jgi:hypothetical protein
MGLSSATDKQKEAAWRVEFEALGEQSVLKNVKQGAIRNEAKRQAAFRWLSEQAQLRDRREAWAAELAWLALLCVNCGGTYRCPGYVDCAPLNAPRRFPPPRSKTTPLLGGYPHFYPQPRGWREL